MIFNTYMHIVGSYDRTKGWFCSVSPLQNHGRTCFKRTYISQELLNFMYMCQMMFYSELIGSRNDNIQVLPSEIQEFPSTSWSKSTSSSSKLIPQAICIGDVIRYDSIKPEKNYKI